MSRMNIQLSTLTFDAEGRGEKAEFAFLGHAELRSGEYRLSWQKEEEGTATKATLSFSLAQRDVLAMRETGGCEALLQFAVGKEYNTPYRIVGVGELPLSIKTERVENSLSPAGGKLRIVYESYIGDVRQRIMLTLVATPAK